MPDRPTAENLIRRFRREHPEHEADFREDPEYGLLMHDRAVTAFIAWAVEKGMMKPARAAAFLKARGRFLEALRYESQ